MVQGMPHPEGHQRGPCTSGDTMGVYRKMELVEGCRTRRATKGAPAPAVTQWECTGEWNWWRGCRTRRATKAPALSHWEYTGEWDWCRGCGTRRANKGAPAPPVSSLGISEARRGHRTLRATEGAPAARAAQCSGWWRGGREQEPPTKPGGMKPRTAERPRSGEQHRGAHATRDNHNGAHATRGTHATRQHEVARHAHVHPEGKGAQAPQKEQLAGDGPADPRVTGWWAARMKKNV